MQSQLQELTDLIYVDGVQKAQVEADAIVSKAQSEADAIVAKAQQEAAELLAKAKQEADTLTKNVNSELKMCSQQAVSALKQQIESCVTLQAIKPGLNETFGTAENLTTIISDLAEAWAKNQQSDLHLVLAAKDKTEIEPKLKVSLASLLNQGVSFDFSANVKSGFKVQPKDASYVISFTEEDFVNFFKTYLRNKTNELLFR
ncbi:MAG: V-type ATP synthase subunit E [Mangrovibacterium sp.]